MSSLLGGIRYDRNNQKQMCPKQSQDWQPSCQLFLEDVKIKFLFFHWMDDDGLSPLPANPNEVRAAFNEPEFYSTDSCTSVPTRNCLERFFNESSENDIVLFSVGGPYGDNSVGINMTAWVVDSAINFKRNLQSVFHGHIFHITQAYMHNDWEHRNPSCYAIDQLIFQTFLNDPGPVKFQHKWHTIDQWSINNG
eukprot:gene34940-45219_t